MRSVLIPPSLERGATSGDPTAELHGLHGETMGTSWTVKLVLPPGIRLSKLRAAIEHELDIVIAQMSNWEADSDISRFNATSADSWHDLPIEFFTVLECALTIAAQSGGAYDPTVGRLVDLWGFGPLPWKGAASADAIAEATRIIGWHRVRLDRDGRRALQPGGVQLDLSSIAKGFAVDQVAACLDRAGLTSHLVEIGGELRGTGVKPDGRPWWIALELPRDGGTAPIPSPAVVALHGLSIATSGDYRRFFEADGRRLAHTIDPRSGCPVVDAPASVTVLHHSCMQADALATALTVMGSRDGFSFACRHNLPALFVDRCDNGFKDLMTPAFAAMLN